MPEDLFDEPERRAAEKVLAAERLEAQGRLRDALDALNLAIQLAPSSPQAFERRASVFERMGLLPQAEADRRRAADLAAALPGAPAPEEPQPEPIARRKRRPQKAAAPETLAVPEAAAEQAAEIQPEAVPQPQAEEEAAVVVPTGPEAEPAYYSAPIPSDIPREPGGGPGVSRATILVVAAFLIALVIGIAVVFAAISLGGSGSSETSGAIQPTGVATGGGSATPTGEAGATGAVSTSGSPYTLSGLVSAWKAKGLEVKTGGAAQGFKGFKATPVDVTMTRAGSTATAAVFVYKSPDAALEEWDLTPGNRPAAKGDRTVPSLVSAWWNANLVVVLRTDPAGLGRDALDALLNLGG